MSPLLSVASMKMLTKFAVVMSQASARFLESSGRRNI